MEFVCKRYIGYILSYLESRCFSDENERQLYDCAAEPQII